MSQKQTGELDDDFEGLNFDVSAQRDALKQKMRQIQEQEAAQNEAIKTQVNPDSVAVSPSSLGDASPGVQDSVLKKEDEYNDGFEPAGSNKKPLFDSFAPIYSAMGPQNDPVVNFDTNKDAVLSGPQKSRNINNYNLTFGKQTKHDSKGDEVSKEVKMSSTQKKIREENLKKKKEREKKAIEEQSKKNNYTLIQRKIELNRKSEKQQREKMLKNRTEDSIRKHFDCLYEEAKKRKEKLDKKAEENNKIQKQASEELAIRLRSRPAYKPSKKIDLNECIQKQIAASKSNQNQHQNIKGTIFQERLNNDILKHTSRVNPKHKVFYDYKNQYELFDVNKKLATMLHVERKVEKKPAPDVKKIIEQFQGGLSYSKKEKIQQMKESDKKNKADLKAQNELEVKKNQERMQKIKGAKNQKKVNPENTSYKIAFGARVYNNVN